jgi:hypothetical protein
MDRAFILFRFFSVEGLEHANTAQIEMSAKRFK